MTTNRDSICIGLLTKKNFLSISYDRKIIFNYDKYENIGYDLINEISYQINNPNLKKGYCISNIIYLKDTLKELGYPEQISDVHIQRIMGEDFENIFIKNNFMKTLYSCAMENFSPLFYKKTFDTLKNQFNICEDEIRYNEKNYQKQKRK